MYTIWMRWEWKRPQQLKRAASYTTAKVHELIDCANRKSADGASIYYSRDGQPVAQYPDLSDESVKPLASSAIPDTLGEAMLRAVCSYFGEPGY